MESVLRERDIPVETFKPEDWRQCDNCGVLARQEYLDALPAAFPSSDPAPLPDFFQTALKGMSEVLKTGAPPPADRLERLVCALIRSGYCEPHELVGMARAIEREMESPTDPGAYGVYGLLTWRDREHFVEWLLPALDQARELTGEEGCPADVNINRLANHVADYIEGVRHV